ncbi:diphthamide synthesis protein [Candidatus Pacearchaeota archaeon]|nr:diphthamide synthesis protein [Candidatus Pacearchaeota archaeon]
MIKRIFIPAVSRRKISGSKISAISKSLPKNLAVAYSVQFQEIAGQIKEKLSESHIITYFTQVLGCSKPNFPKNTEAILLVGSGKFHAIGLAFETKIPVYILTENKMERITEEETKKLEERHKVHLLKFLHSEKIGVIISNKPGQERLRRALEVSKKTEKKTYFFLSNNVELKEFENFGLDCWINTACPRMDFDRSLINLTEIENHFK